MAAESTGEEKPQATGIPKAVFVVRSQY